MVPEWEDLSTRAARVVFEQLAAEMSRGDAGAAVYVLAPAS